MFNEKEQILLALLLLFIAPTALILARAFREKRAVSVTVLITKIEALKIDDHSGHYPTFKVTSGVHKDRKYRSDWDCGAHTYQVGETVEAKIFPNTGEIFVRNRTHAEWISWFAAFFIFFGLTISWWAGGLF